MDGGRARQARVIQVIGGGIVVVGLFLYAVVGWHLDEMWKPLLLYPAITVSGAGIASYAERMYRHALDADREEG